MNPPKDDFSRVLEQVHEIAGSDFPNTAVWEVPTILEQSTKVKLMRLNVEAVADVLVNAIEEINSGSIVTLNELVKRRLNGIRQ